jgi:hypothetical protein
VERPARASNVATDKEVPMNEIAALRSLSILVTLALAALALGISTLF